MLAFDDVAGAGDAVARVNPHEPIALEGIDDRLLRFMDVKHFRTEDEWLLPGGDGKAEGWLMCEFGSVGELEPAIAAARGCETDLLAHGAIGSRLIVDLGEQRALWGVREAALGVTVKVPGEPPYYQGWEDSAVPPERVGDYLRELRALYDKYGYDASFYGHFGQGCIHCSVSFDLASHEGVERWKAFLEEAARMIRRYGGSLSGEHGDGQARGNLLPIMYGETLVEAFRAYKRLWDPLGKMNPGKLVDAYAVDADLREGPYYRPHDPATHFSFAPDDRGSFAYATNRCVGVGECRRHEGGTMCPSYRVTREERHATRGRARLLFEMLEGAPLRDGWKSEAVKSALDLCLACKGCKHDCPVNVDMATYKAEFLSHYYRGRRRPVWAYAFGLIPWWAHLGSRVARLANAISQSPGARQRSLKRSCGWRRSGAFLRSPKSRSRTGIAGTARPRGRMRGASASCSGPTPSTITFTPRRRATRWRCSNVQATTWSSRRGASAAAVRSTTMGCSILRKRCCANILDELRPEIEAGTPVVGLEPSCVAVFKDELINMFPNDADAKRLHDNVVMIGDFLARDAVVAAAASRRLGNGSRALPPEIRAGNQGRRSGSRSYGRRAHAGSTTAAAAWRAPSGSKPANTTTSRSKPANLRCFPTCAMPLSAISSSPTVFRVANRSRRRRIASAPSRRRHPYGTHPPR